MAGRLPDNWKSNPSQPPTQGSKWREGEFYQGCTRCSINHEKRNKTAIAKKNNNNNKKKVVVASAPRGVCR